jgi:uncharacterized protein
MADALLSGLEAMAHAAQAGVERGAAPVHLWNPGHCGEIDIRIAPDGRWFHEGRPITRQQLVRLFSTILRRDQDGFHLVTPGEKLRIRVDDAPFVAIALDQPEAGVLRFVTNVGDLIEAGPEHPLRVAVRADGEPRPYLLVRDGLEALLSRTVFYDLAALAAPAPGGGVMSVLSNGVWFPLEAQT